MNTNNKNCNFNINLKEIAKTFNKEPTNSENKYEMCTRETKKMQIKHNLFFLYFLNSSFLDNNA
jgi:hypothetical protein